MNTYDKLLESCLRIKETVPLMQEAANKWPHNRDFWLKSAEQEQGHFELLIEELKQAFGEDFEEDLKKVKPRQKLIDLLNWVNLEEVNHLVYKAFLELLFVDPGAENTRNFWRQYCPKFVALHEEADQWHPLEALELLKGRNCDAEVKFIVECLQ